MNVSTVYERAFSGKTGEESDYNPKRKLKPSGKLSLKNNVDVTEFVEW